MSAFKRSILERRGLSEVQRFTIFRTTFLWVKLQRLWTSCHLQKRLQDLQALKKTPDTNVQLLLSAQSCSTSTSGRGSVHIWDGNIHADGLIRVSEQRALPSSHSSADQADLLPSEFNQLPTCFFFYSGLLPFCFFKNNQMNTVGQ